MASIYSQGMRSRARATSISFSFSNNSPQSSELVTSGTYNRNSMQRLPAQLKGFKAVRTDSSIRDTSSSCFTEDLGRSKLLHEGDAKDERRKHACTLTNITPDAVGAEGAAALTQATIARARQNRRDTMNSTHDEDDSCNKHKNNLNDMKVKHENGEKGAKNSHAEDDDVLLQMRLPVSAVLDDIRYHHDQAVFWNELLWHIPFLVLFTLMLLLGNSDSLQVFINGDSVRRMSDINLYTLTDIQTRILLEAFRIDSEQNNNNATTPFVPGGSSKFPWMYSNYDQYRNAWTSQPHASSAVDDQENRIAQVFRNPNIVNFWSIRTKRDLMRWLTDSFVPLYWNCESSDYEEPWLSVRGGSNRMVGSVRLTSQRRLTDNVTQKCKRPALDGIVNCEATDSGTVAQPPLTPSTICGQVNPSLTTATLFKFDTKTKGYTALLPFTASCSNVERTLSYMQTRKQPIVWSNGSSYVGMNELWSKYQMDEPSMESCSSFLFHRSVSSFKLEYVTYATAINSFMYTSMIFDFVSTGTVAVPNLVIDVAPVFAWETHFTKLAFSIVVAVYWIYYGMHIVSHHAECYRRTMSAKRKNQQTALTRFIVLMQQLCDVWSLLLFCSLIFTAAYLITLWLSWSRLGGFIHLMYHARTDYPDEIARYCQHNVPLLIRFLSAAVFFTYAHTMRYISVLSGCWIMLESLHAATARMLSAVTVWMLAAVGMSISAMLLFGTQMSQFSTLENAYNSLLLLFVDRNKYMFSGLGEGTSSTGYDSTAPSARGGLLRWNEMTVMELKRNKMRICSPPMWELFFYAFYFIFIIIFAGWLIAMMMESYQQTLSRQTQMGTTGIGLTYRALRRSMNRIYWMESVRHALWTRPCATLYAEMETTLRNAYFGGVNDVSKSTGVRVYDASNRSVTYLGVLWLFPRSLQAEVGPMHIRCWWQSCADSVSQSHSNDVSWFTQQWRRYWETGKDGLQGWLQRVVPPEVELESRAVDVGLLLEELPTHIVKYVERSTSRTPRAD